MNLIVNENLAKHMFSKPGRRYKNFYGLCEKDRENLLFLLSSPDAINDLEDSLFDHMFDLANTLSPNKSFCDIFSILCTWFNDNKKLLLSGGLLTLRGGCYVPSEKIIGKLTSFRWTKGDTSHKEIHRLWLYMVISEHGVDDAAFVVKISPTMQMMTIVEDGIYEFDEESIR